MARGQLMSPSEAMNLIAPLRWEYAERLRRDIERDNKAIAG